MTAIQLSRAWPEIDEAVRILIEGRRAENTKRAYTADWARWRVFVGSNGIDLCVPGLAMTAAFRDQLASDGLGPSSVARVLASLSFFYAALRDTGLVHANPFTRAWLPRPEVGTLHKTPVVNDTAVAQLEQSIANDSTPAGRHDAALVRLLYDTGLRRASLATLKRDQIRQDGDHLVMGVIVKGGKEQLVRLTQEAARALAAWLTLAPPSPYVFSKRFRHAEHIPLAVINKILRDRAIEAGLDPATIHPHRFRAAFITAAYDAHLYERDIQSAVHHSNATTTRGYDRGARGDAVFDLVAAHRKGKK